MRASAKVGGRALAGTSVPLLAGYLASTGAEWGQELWWGVLSCARVISWINSLEDGQAKNIRERGGISKVQAVHSLPFQK